MVDLVRKGIRTYFYGSPAELEVIYRALTKFVEGAVFSKLYKEGKWDGKARFYDKRGRWFWFGLIERVLEALSKEEIDYNLEGYFEYDSDWIEFSQPFRSEERDYQRKAIRLFIEQSYGVIQIATRGGKTFVAAEIIRLLNKRFNGFKTLFLVDSVDLFNQAIGDICSVTNLQPGEIGRIRGKDFELRQINVGMIQTVQSVLKGKLLTKESTIENFRASRIRRRSMIDLLESLDFLIVDEVHEFGKSRQRLETIRKAQNIKFILALSATTFKVRDEIHRINIESFSGGIVYDIPEKELVAKGVLAKSRTLALFLDYDLHSYELSKNYRQIVNDVIINNNKRNNLIVDVAKTCEKLGLKTLLIFNSVEHGEIISKLTKYTFLSGKDDDKKRQNDKNNFLSKRGGVFLVSDIWKKGVTLPSVEVLFNVDGGKESSLVIQRRGRVLGVTEKKKKALCIDIIDDFPKYLDNHGALRVKAYESKLGKGTTDMIEVKDLDFQNQLEDYLINWFELNIQ